MFYVRPQRPEEYFTNAISIPPSISISELNEICLFNNLQRQYAYKQQQIEKRQVQKMNQPIIEYAQDMRNYYILLFKKVNKSNYQYINKFNGYSLKQYDGNSLIIKSSKDNFYKNFTLPENIDVNEDITYKLVSNGYKMVVSIPKKTTKYQLKTQTFGLPDMFNNLRLLCDTLDSNSKVHNCQSKERKTPERNDSRIRIPITGEEQFQNITLNNNYKKEKEKEQEKEKENSESVVDKQDNVENHEEQEQEQKEEDANLQSLVADAEQEFTNEIKETTQVDALKNYNTIRRQTVFLPNINSEGSAEEKDLETKKSVSVPLRRKTTPTIEDLVDAEFL